MEQPLAENLRRRPAQRRNVTGLCRHVRLKAMGGQLVLVLKCAESEAAF